MPPWPKRPIIYEINTWVWLNELSHRYQRPIDLGSVPSAEWDTLAAYGFDAIWLMGVWERSPLGTQIARSDVTLLDAYRRVLPDFTPSDVVGSPYCVHRYIVDRQLGGPAGLAQARVALAQRRLRLILDFVPNHVARDHPWTTEHPEYFVQGTPADWARAPDKFFSANGRIIALGRDPHFPPWQDVAQLNAFQPALRRAMHSTLFDLAQQCDGVRCDMAMLMLTEVFLWTWRQLAGAPPGVDYWTDLISAVRETRSDFLFVAEAYWDLEYALQQQGFDYCYDKRLYDRLAKERAESVRLHLLADFGYQDKLVRFIENHDEPRAAAIFDHKAQAAALTIGLLPGAKLLHDGQLDGRRVRLPIQLSRRPLEPVDAATHVFYQQLLSAMNLLPVREGVWQLCERSGWPDNPSYENLVAWCWRTGDRRLLVVVNLSDVASQAHVRLPWNDLASQTWRLTDLFTGEVFKREGDELRQPGLYVDRLAWHFHVLSLERA